MFNTTPPEDLAESERRVADAIERFDAHLREEEWLAGPDFSLADIGVFASFYGLPLSQPEAVNDAATPALMRWLRHCHARPGLRAAFAMGRGIFGRRAAKVRALIGIEGAAAA